MDRLGWTGAGHRDHLRRPCCLQPREEPPPSVAGLEPGFGLHTDQPAWPRHGAGRSAWPGLGRRHYFYALSRLLLDLVASHELTAICLLADSNCQTRFPDR